MMVASNETLLKLLVSFDAFFHITLPKNTDPARIGIFIFFFLTFSHEPL